MLHNTTVVFSCKVLIEIQNSFGIEAETEEAFKDLKLLAKCVTDPAIVVGGGHSFIFWSNCF